MSQLPQTLGGLKADPQFDTYAPRSVRKNSAPTSSLPSAMAMNCSRALWGMTIR